MPDRIRARDVGVPMTLAEAYVLHRHYQNAEKASAAKGDYAAAQQHKERAAEIGRAFWPADDWERAWADNP